MPSGSSKVASSISWLSPSPGLYGSATTVAEARTLEMGGADTLDNIWPQCGPKGVNLNDRYFKQKDLVENYLTAQVKSGAMDLETARHKIAADWTQFLAAAKQSAPPVTE